MKYKLVGWNSDFGNWITDAWNKFYIIDFPIDVNGTIQPNNDTWVEISCLRKCKNKIGQDIYVRKTTLKRPLNNFEYLRI